MSLKPNTADVVKILERIRARHTLVHCMTNGVVKNFTANVLLALGAAPAMVEHPDETEDFAPIANALLINIGTLDEMQMTAMRHAIPAAVAAGKPWVLDPVAVGALRTRTRFAEEIVKHHPRIVRGNASEILTMAGMGGNARGADSCDSAEDAVDAAKALARQTGGAVLVTGVVDYAIDGETVVACANGHPLLTRVTGVGCSQGAIAAACAAEAETPLAGAVAAAVILGVAGEIAAERNPRPGSFQIGLIDALDELDAGILLAKTRLS
jgi:hydroxyethylthiazole kinase